MAEARRGGQDGPARSRPRERPGELTSLDRGLLILEELAVSDAGMTVGALAKATGLNRTTAYRLCDALERGAWIQNTRARGGIAQIHLGPRVLGLSVLIGGKYGLEERLRPIIDRLADELQETVHVGILEGTDVLHVARAVVSDAVITLAARLGARDLAHVTALGKALLATLPEEEVGRLYRREALPIRTAKSISERKELLADLELTRERGYALDDEESSISVKCLAAPVFGPLGDALFAISVTTTPARLEGRTAGVASAVIAAASEATASFGGRLPSLPWPRGHGQTA